MKRIFTILMLVVVVLVGGMTVDAKTTKKKGKARTTQTSSSALWNGDIPSALFIYTLNCGYSERHFKEFRKHGYKLDNSGIYDSFWVKSNICTVYIDASYTEDPEINGTDIVIWIKDSSSRNKLYNDLKKLIAQKGTGNTCSVRLLDDGKIGFFKEP